MAWQVDDIRKKFTQFINNDPDPYYSQITNPEKPKTDPRPNQDPDEWDAIWHYLDRAIYEVVPSSNRVGTIYATSTTSTSTETPLPVDTWEVQDDPPFQDPTVGEIKVTEATRYQIESAVQLTAPSGGSAKASIAPQLSTDGGSSWSDITRVDLTVPAFSASSSASLSVPSYTIALSADDRIRVLVRYESGNGSDVIVEGGWITVTEQQ